MGSKPSSSLEVGGGEEGESPAVRVFCWSDLHVEEPENDELVGRLTKEDFGNDILLVAGDVAMSLKALEKCLRHLVAVFKHVLYVTGNNELRLSKTVGDESSIDKFERIMALCDEVGVITKPFRVNATTVIVPLFSWYEPSFSPSYEEGDESYKRGWLDFRTVRWPDVLRSPRQQVEYFLDLNERAIAAFGDTMENDTVITFSHFLPRRELLPTFALWRKPSLAMVTGSVLLDSQLRQIHSTIHVYGHSHVNGDTTIEGVRYVQAALGHAAERDGYLAYLSGCPFLLITVAGLPLPQDEHFSEAD